MVIVKKSHSQKLIGKQLLISWDMNTLTVMLLYVVAIQQHMLIGKTAVFHTGKHMIHM